MVHVVTLIITGTSALYVIRQKTTEYLQVRNLLVMVHVFYMGVVGLELGRNFISTDFYLEVYTIANTTFVLVDVVLLTMIAIAIYYRPNGRHLIDILREVAKHQNQATLFIVYMLYIAIAEGFLLVYRPFVPQSIVNLLGQTVLATQFNSQYLAMLFGILVVFLVYPSLLLVAARARTQDVQVRKAFIILPIAWVGIGLDLLIFNGYILNSGIDASAVGYLFAAAAFSATAATFRRATLLSSFFLPVAAPVPVTGPSSTFSGRLGLEADRILGRTFLLEINPAVRYEESIRDLALELSSKGQVLFAFTSKGSPVYAALSGHDNVRFFTLTTRVSYPKPGDLPTEVLVPAGDQSVILNVLHKTLTSNPELKLGLVFDSVTDLLLSSGLETTFKFLKQAIEMVSTYGVTAVFLITGGAHSEREVSVVKSLFSNQLSYGSGQLSVQKAG